MASTIHQATRHTEPLSGISDEEDNVRQDSSITASGLGHTDATVPITEAATRRTSPFLPAVKASAFVKWNLCNTEYAARYEVVVAAAMSMSKTELQALYASEYNSLRSRRQQAKQRHIKFADSLKDFRDWLIHLGPRPSEGYTVDRIKSAKTKGYVPGNLRWATNIVQTQNRRVTKWHQLPDGSRLTTMQFAKRLGVSYPTLYKRLNNGWTIDRLLQGEPPMTLAEWKFPPELALYCQPLYNQFRKIHRLPRIEWFINHFDDLAWGRKRGNELGLESNTLPSLEKHLERARQAHKEIDKAIKLYEEKKLRELIAIYDPPTISPTTYAAPVTAHDLCPQAIHPDRIASDPVPPIPKEPPYKPTSTEIAEMMAKFRELAALHP